MILHQLKFHDEVDKDLFLKHATFLFYNNSVSTRITGSTCSYGVIAYTEYG